MLHIMGGGGDELDNTRRQGYTHITTTGQGDRLDTGHAAKDEKG